MNLPEAFRAACERAGLAPTTHCLHVRTATQTMVHFHGTSETEFTISTATAGTGQQNGSFQTPLGHGRTA